MMIFSPEKPPDEFMVVIVIRNRDGDEPTLHDSRSMLCCRALLLPVIQKYLLAHRWSAATLVLGELIRCNAADVHFCTEREGP
jgi:hypothetical protein